MSSFFRKIAVLVIGLFAVAAFFRLALASGFESVPGDVWDGRLLFGIVDHWRQWFAGQCAWNDLGIFWPMPNTLAYSDTFFIDGVPYAAFCALGVEPLVAYTLVFMLEAFVGYLSMYWLLKRFFKIEWWFSALCAAVFVNIASMQLSIDSSHLQMTIAWLSPLVVGSAWRALEGGRRAWLWAAGAAALLSAMFLSAYYMTWFLAFFLSIFTFFWLVYRAAARNGETLKAKCLDLAAWLRDKRIAIAGFAVAFAIAIIPFLVLYLPAIGQFGKRKFKGILSGLPGPVDFINVGERNYFWGWFARGLGLDGRQFGGELNFGIPPLTLALFLTAMGVLIFFALRRRKLDLPERIALVAGLAVFFSWILLYRHNQDSAWYFVLKFVPGAGAMRAVFRMNLLLAIVSLVVTAVVLGRLVSRKGWAALLAAGLVIVVFAEQFASPRTDNRILRSVEVRNMAMIPPPPSDARIFFMVPDFSHGRDAIDMVKEHMTALLVAGKYNLHTLNGHTGQVPYGWNLDITGDRYFRNAAQWLNDHGAPSGVYGLDAAHGKWMAPDFISDPVGYPFGLEVVNREVFDRYAWVGWSGVEPWGVWSDGKHSEFRFAVKDTGRSLVVKIAFHAFTPNGLKQRFAMYVNKREVGRWLVAEGDHLKEEIRVDASEVRDGRLFLAFDFPDAVSPQSLGGATDPRILGMGLDSLVIVPVE